MDNEAEIKDSLRKKAKALVEKDKDKILQFYAEDAKVVTNEGTYEGRKEIGKYWQFILGQFSEIQLEESEPLVQGNKAAHEYTVKGETVNGRRVEFPLIVAYEFTKDKIQKAHIYYDRLTLAKQAAEGWLGKRIVNSVVKRMEEGLERKS
ncbi:hypothetical protein AKJ38_01380 [candidate division MSBL1 archaeon SCGC-AAA259I14]|uniref:SnoaL-like domain-containing protein n=1 Tax=candidate division MSBL1 archaeon SCGC-AAA259I14 TaxID=1698268 RepID=A0A133UT13_9EURY|nr:hypothetical protein AKJ38_01380 [candidate division MSBL1 archaeon SCGC-AAA259I14]